jgi:hypothetical protein
LLLRVREIFSDLLLYLVLLAIEEMVEEGGGRQLAGHLHEGEVRLLHPTGAHPQWRFVHASVHPAANIMAERRPLQALAHVRALRIDCPRQLIYK